MAKFARPSKALLDALVTAGVIDDPNTVRRVLIDIQSNQSPMVYVEKWGDADALADVVAEVAAEFGPGNLVPPARDEKEA
jgi:hypothetical protein